MEKKKRGRLHKELIMIGDVRQILWRAELEEKAEQKTGQLWGQEEFIQDAPSSSLVFPLPASPRYIISL